MRCLRWTLHSVSIQVVSFLQESEKPCNPPAFPSSSSSSFSSSSSSSDLLLLDFIQHSGRVDSYLIPRLTLTACRIFCLRVRGRVGLISCCASSKHLTALWAASSSSQRSVSCCSLTADGSQAGGSVRGDDVTVSQDQSINQLTWNTLTDTVSFYLTGQNKELKDGVQRHSYLKQSANTWEQRKEVKMLQTMLKVRLK